MMFAVRVCALVLCAFSSLLFADEEQALPSFFSYPPEELNHLQKLKTDSTMDVQEMRKWDSLASRAVEEKKINFYDFTRIFTYLYIAQSEAVSLSRNLVGEPKGSLDPVSYQVLSLFFPGFAKPELYTEDPFSVALAKIITKQIEARINRENSLKISFTVPETLQKDFAAGTQVAKWIPWIAKPSIDYWPPPPPAPNSPIWKEQIVSIKEAQSPMTEHKKEMVYRWAGLAYPWSDDWRTIVNQYLLCHNVPLEKMTAVRATLMTGLYDCVAAYVSCKYHYLSVRPKFVDPSVQYIIQVPRHPTYPSGHATESTLSAKILSYFFPNDARYWQQLAQDCRISRIWSGIHFPIDNEAGKICATKVADKVLSDLFKVKESP